MILYLFGKKSYFRILDLKIDILPLKMILNHQHNIRNRYFCQNYTKSGITLAPTFMIFLLRPYNIVDI